MSMKGDPLDPKGLIYESYQMEGITKSECRTIFLDWALSLPMENDPKASMRDLLERYKGQGADHPMSEVLNEGLVGMATPRRRGGWRSRARN